MKRFTSLCLTVVLCTMLMSGCVGVNIFDNARNTTEDKQSKEEIAYEKWIEELPAGAYNPSDMSWRNPANITKTIEYGTSLSIVMDTFGYPHILFDHGDWKYEDVYYIKWNGKNWVCVDGSVYDSRIIPNPANASRSIKGSNSHHLALDSQNNPHITWKDKQFLATSETFNFTTDIIYIHWDGNDWVCVDGSVYNSEIKKDNPAIIDTGNSRSYGAQVEIDSKDYPHIVWSGGWLDNEEIAYIKWNGENWLCADGSMFDPENTTDSNPANISRNIGDSGPLHLVLDSSNNPHVAWCDLSFGEEMEVLYIKWNGNDWVCADDSVYNPKDISLTNPVNMSRNKGGSWHPFLVLDSKNSPHITWQESNNTDDSNGVHYSYWNNNNWVCADGSVYSPDANTANISRTGEEHTFPTLALDKLDAPHIGWRDEVFCFEEDSETAYVTWKDNNWVCVDGSVYDPTDLSILNPVNVSKSTFSSSFLQVVFDASGNTCVAWENSCEKGSNVFFVKWDGSYWIPLR